MREFFKKLTALFLVFLIVVAPVTAKEHLKFNSGIQQEFSPSYLPDFVSFKNSGDVRVNEEITIPTNSLITVDILEAQKERRWHKSGYILCKLNSYQTQDSENPTDLTNKNIYLIGRKYEELNKKDATILGTELVLTQAASIVGSLFIFFAPVDIAYFFTKGAIQREKDPNWFKAGFYNAYDNSIMWFWFKGKPIELAQNDTVQLKEIKEKKALKLQNKIGKRKAKKALKAEKKRLKAERKQVFEQTECY